MISQPLRRCQDHFLRLFSVRKYVKASEHDSTRGDEYKDESVEELLKNSANFEHMKPEADSQMEFLTSPYPEGANMQSSHAVRPSIDPKLTSILLFPGQGSQFVGMGKGLLKLPQVMDMYKVASDILGYDLLHLCLNGPKAELDKTVHCQPAVVVTSLAAVEKLKEERPTAIDSCVATAGFSVGELSALSFAGVISFPDVVKLVKVRAEAMQLASDLTPSGMMVVFFGPESKLNYACSVAREWCQKKGLENVDCRVANYLYPHCKVIAGNIEALEFIQKNASDFKLRRLKWLPVSGAFHTSLMKPAVQPFRMALQNITLDPPLIPVHTNVDAKCYSGPEHVRKVLPKQIVQPVRWEQIMHVLYKRKDGNDFPRSYECGPGSSLKNILAMVNLKASQSCHFIEI